MTLGCQDRQLRLNIVVLRLCLLIKHLCKCTSLYPLSPTETFHKFCDVIEKTGDPTDVELAKWGREFIENKHGTISAQ